MMVDQPVEPDDLDLAENAEIDRFRERVRLEFTRLFEAARDAEEVQFVLALCPEMRGMQDEGWSTAQEAMATLSDYTELLDALPLTRARIRIALSLYAHLSEASGFYEMPKNMLRLVSGQGYSMVPFIDLVERHARTGQVVAPNAKRIMQDMIGHANEAGYEDLTAMILEAFDFELRHAYAHADYIIRHDGIRLRHRNGGHARIVRMDDFAMKLNKAIQFFEALREVWGNFVRSYDPPKLVQGRLNNEARIEPTLLSYDPQTGALSMRQGGLG